MYSITSMDCSVSKLVYKKAITHTHGAEESESHQDPADMWSTQKWNNQQGFEKE